MKVLFLVATFALGSFAGPDELPTINKLRKELFVTREYSPNVRPVRIHTTPTIISVHFIVYQLAEMYKNTMTLNCFIRLVWKDEHLSWNTADFDGLDRLEVNEDEIWLPDVQVWSSLSTKSSEELERTQIIVNDTGHVLWDTKVLVQVPCFLNLQDYPFDTQKCRLSFGPWMYRKEEVQLTTLYEDLVYAETFLENPEFEVTKVNSSLMNDYVYSRMVVVVEAKRRVSVFHYLITLPYLGASFMAITMFWVPIGSTYRYAFGGLAVILLSVLLWILAFQLGTWSRFVPYAIQSVSINLMLTVIFMILTSVLNIWLRSLVSRKVSMPLFLQSLLNNQLAKSIYLNWNSKSSNVLLVEDEDEDEEALEEVARSDGDFSGEKWLQLLQIVDKTFFLLYLLALIVYHC